LQPDVLLALQRLVFITDAVLSVWFASYTVLVSGFAAIPAGATPTVVVGAKRVHPEMWVALHLDASSTQTLFASWLGT
jgi:hypothetical protein